MLNILVSNSGLLRDPKRGKEAQKPFHFFSKKPPSKAERFLVGKRTGVSNLFDDIERVVNF